MTAAVQQIRELLTQIGREQAWLDQFSSDHREFTEVRDRLNVYRTRLKPLLDANQKLLLRRAIFQRCSVITVVQENVGPMGYIAYNFLADMTDFHKAIARAIFPQYCPSVSEFWRIDLFVTDAIFQFDRLIAEVPSWMTYQVLVQEDPILI